MEGFIVIHHAREDESHHNNIATKEAISKEYHSLMKEYDENDHDGVCRELLDLATLCLNTYHHMRGDE